jgi:PAT family beta-lactamase induction signal transducer AmpG
MTKSFRLFIFSSLYFAQGMLMSYFLTFNILYLGEAGYTTAEVGIFQAILAIPFVLKIFLGMLSDGVNLLGFGHRKPYILLGLLGQMIAMLAAPSTSLADGISTFALIALVASVSMALYDTCTDGLALDTTPENERGTVQGLMVGARAFGILVMLVLGGEIADAAGWSWVFYTLSAITVLPLIGSLWIKEPAAITERPAFEWAAFKKFASGMVLLLAAVGFIYSVALDGVLTYLSDFLREALDVSIGEIGLLVAFSMLGRILGALSNSFLTDRIGTKRSLYVAIGLTSLGCLGLAISGSIYWLGAFGFIFGLAYGYYTAVYAAVAMKISDPRIAASMFAIFMMFINLGTVGGQAIGGLVTEAWGFSVMVLVFGVLNLVNIPLVVKMFKERASG